MTLVRDVAGAKRSGGSDAKSGQAGRTRGVGNAEIKVKGVRATAKQRSTIDGVLQEAQSERASRRVMIAAIMCITQESGAGVLEEPSGAHLGPFQQEASAFYGSAAQRRDPTHSTSRFLAEWKRVNGGIKKAPGDLATGIELVQRSGRPDLYRQWEPEATRTVDHVLASGDVGEATYIKRYLFTRGERHGARENSWDAMARLVGEVGAYRWAAGNVLYAVSGDELRAGAASLTIDGDEPWLLAPPQWSWANNRAVVEVTLRVLADRWDVMPGAAVIMHDKFGVTSGRYMVWNVAGDRLDSPVATVVLRRPTRLKAEPASEVGTRSGGVSGTLVQIAKTISDNRHEYVYGGSHGPPLSKLKPSSPFDCSSSCSYALYKADMFDGNVAIVSGAFASSWGKHGKGDEFTVWANGEHVWIEGYDSDHKPAWRFDTSHHGGKSGPMYTTVARSDQSRFTPRHWPGH